MRINRMLGKFFSALLLIVLVPSLALSNTAEPLPAEETQFAFANYLLQNHDYFRAATEFKRLLFLYPSGTKVDEANYLLGEAQFLPQIL